jgi:hypothetical protein
MMKRTLLMRTRALRNHDRSAPNRSPLELKLPGAEG